MKVAALSQAVSLVRKRSAENRFGKYMIDYSACPCCKSLLRNKICPNEHCDQYLKKPKIQLKSLDK